MSADGPVNGLQIEFHLPNAYSQTHGSSLSGGHCSTAAVDNPVRSQGDETESGCGINRRDWNGQRMINPALGLNHPLVQCC